MQDGDLRSDFDGLCSWLAGAQNIHVLEIIKRLLAFCRKHGQVVMAAERGSRQLLLASHRTSAAFAGRLAADDVGSSTLTQPLLGDLAALLDGHLESVAPEESEKARALAVRRLAKAIDAALGHRVATSWSTSGDKELRPGDLVPVFCPLADKAFRAAYGRVGTPPAKLDRSPDVLGSAVLVPEQLPHSLQLVAHTNWHALDELEPSSRIVCSVPSDPDFDIVEKDSEAKTFFGVRPRDPAAQRAQTIKLLEAADREQAKAVVLPELCLDSEGIEEVALWIETKAKHIALAVCGTHHCERSGRRNVAVLASPFSPRLEQAKVVGVSWPVDATELLEDIERQNTTLLLISGRVWSAVILICRDFIDAQLSSLVLALRASLVLVPACSWRTVDFQATAGRLASQGQAHSVVANQCSPSDAETSDVAILGRPTNDANQQLARMGRGTARVPHNNLILLNNGPWNQQHNP